MQKNLKKTVERNQKKKKTNKRIKLFSPAKINLFFEVINKRSDGFHNIKSLMRAVSFYDEIKIEILDNSYKKDFFFSNTSLQWNSSNLIFKAVDIFRKYINENFFVKITLDKKIPMQSGLGGGSSNAATVLFALNNLFYNHFSMEKMCLIASNLGCDVPFFFSCGTAICRGKGDLLEEDAFCLEKSYHIAVPKFGMSTQIVYKNLDLNKLKKNKSPYFNDLEKTAFLLNPELIKFKKRLLKLNFSHVVMSGSGSAFVCIGEKDQIINNLDNEIYLYKIYSIFRKKNYWYNQ